MRKTMAQQRNKYKILVVDDEPGVVESLRVVLGRSGYTVEGEINPLEAVERLRRSGIITGKGDDSFDPEGTTTRAELATVFHRIILAALREASA